MVFKVGVIGRYLAKSGGLTVFYAGFAVSGMTTGGGKLLGFDCEFNIEISGSAVVFLMHSNI